VKYVYDGAERLTRIHSLGGTLIQERTYDTAVGAEEGVDGLEEGGLLVRRQGFDPFEASEDLAARFPAVGLGGLDAEEKRLARRIEATGTCDATDRRILARRRRLGRPPA
jgi:hypothetical protein